MRTGWLTLLSGILALVCSGAGPAHSEKRAVNFERDIQPILDANCVICHQRGAAPQGLVLEQGLSRAALISRRSTEATALMLVAPGMADDSYLVAKLENRQLTVGGTGAQMPLGGHLDPGAIADIRRWITEGAGD